MNKEQRAKQNSNKKQFDLNVHVRNAKGQIVDENHYRLTIKNGIKEFERPPGSGNFYDEGGTLMRQVKPKVDPKAVIKNEKQMQDILAQLEELKAQNAELQAQLNEEKELEEPSSLDVIVPEIPLTETDNSEEIALMKAAGALDDAKALEEASKKPLFSKPSFLK